MLYLGFFIFTTLGLSYIPALVHLIKCMIPSWMWFLSTNWQKILWQLFRHIDQKTYCNGFIFWWMMKICATGITSNVCEQIKYNVRVAVNNGASGAVTNDNYTWIASRWSSFRQPMYFIFYMHLWLYNTEKSFRTPTDWSLRLCR